MFISILRAELPEDVYYDCQKMIRILRNAMLESAIKVGTFVNMHCMDYNQIL